MDKAQFGVFLPSYLFQRREIPPCQLFNRIRDVVLECERLGYHSVWLDDHLMLRNNPILECWTTLAALAAASTRIRLGTMVTATEFRNPALLAKMAATVDVISGGRVEFGIGSGVQKHEHEAYGYQFPDAPARTRRMKEAIEIIKMMWTQPRASYRGRYYRVEDAMCEPKPLQKPHPPITIGGIGERHTLKVTAQLADRFDFGYLPDIEEYKHKLEMLKTHCAAVGRDFDEIGKSCWPTGQILLSQNPNSLEEKIQRLNPEGVSRGDFEKFSFIGSPEDFAETLLPYLNLGVSNFMLFFGDLPETGSLRLFAEITNKMY